MPIIMIRILIKGLSDKFYLRKFANRVGYVRNLSPDKSFIWIHAVSLGEVISSKGLIDEIKKDLNSHQQFHNYRILLSTSTGTGLRRAIDIHGEDIQIIFSPWDFLPFISRFLNTFDIKIAIFFETEIWPNTIKQCSKKKIPTIIANARISEKSFTNYKKLSKLAPWMFPNIDMILAQDSYHVQRFKLLNANSVQKVGTVKFDEVHTKNDLFNDDFIENIINKPFVLAASTHSGEEEIIISEYQQMRELISPLPIAVESSLVIVPRHPERSKSLVKLSKKMGEKPCLLSELKELDRGSKFWGHGSRFTKKRSREISIIIVDEIGMLDSLYAHASFAFIGGSLVPRGGHNVIEAARNECPFILGKHFFNFDTVVKKFIDAQATLVIGKNDLSTFGFDFFNDKDIRERLKLNAIKVVDENKGSTRRQADYILECIN